jgi:hypothetical protein
MAGKKLSLLLAVLLAVAFFTLEAHHHDDGAAHPDCSLCAARSDAQSASVGQLTSGRPVLPVAFLKPHREGASAPSSSRATPVIRGPPPA